MLDRAGRGYGRRTTLLLLVGFTILSSTACEGLLPPPQVPPGVAPPPAAAGDQIYYAPSIAGQRIDWCFQWATQCGEPAATAFCQRMGFQRASGWTQATDIGAQSPTLVLGSNAVCNQSFCDGFQSITCTRAAAAGPPPAPFPPGPPPQIPPAGPPGATNPATYARCKQYAQSAVTQNEQNLQKGCGFGGPRWGSNHRQHYDWCVLVPQALADSENQARINDLNTKCAAVPPPGPAALTILPSKCVIGPVYLPPVAYVQGGGSFQKCEQECRSETWCGAFTFRRANCNQSYAICERFQKGKSLGFNVDPCCNSGLLK